LQWEDEEEVEGPPVMHLGKEYYKDLDELRRLILSDREDEEEPVVTPSPKKTVKGKKSAKKKTGNKKANSK
jgi:hypothetical protein